MCGLPPPCCSLEMRSLLGIDNHAFRTSFVQPDLLEVLAVLSVRLLFPLGAWRNWYLFL